MTKADAAAVFGVCVKTIDNYAKDGLLPRPATFASKEYWHPADFESFIDQTFRRELPKVESATSISSPHPAECVNDADDQGPLRRLTTKDSHPGVRAKARQHAMLKRLNAEG